jgi:diguanylate cyclase (GGDEF)-like protein
VDIDEFKPINDTWGHDAGDEVLAVVARSLLGVVRPFDVVCRWGGDEFLAVVQNVDSRSLTSVAERMRGIVESSSVEYDNRSISATVSVGGALSRRGEPADGMLVRVDALLYEAKEAGRNRTRID